jgi:hypothetical protein
MEHQTVFDKIIDEKDGPVSPYIAIHRAIVCAYNHEETIEVCADALDQALKILAN